MKDFFFTNELSTATSPYLLQHANNPVAWKTWNDGVLKLAIQEDKLLLISIGYATCHWCHVMEKECFEDENVAEIMNAFYVNIKVDREERPDIDSVYMNALQLMTGSGGWPLNIVALPNGKPVWGGTYFPKQNWMEALQQIQKIFQIQPEKLEEYALKLEKGIMEMDILPLSKKENSWVDFRLENLLPLQHSQWDWRWGGSKREPKFMMPGYLHFLLRYACQHKDAEVNEYVNLTLLKMGYGGIYDHVEGGFSRYAVDAIWHIPHFEKMLYDNALLVSLYCDAYLISKNELYKNIVIETLDFIKRELTDASGGFYSALDADSLNEQGILEEGAYYVFTKEILQEQLGEDFLLFSAYYNISDFGYWENNQYVLIRTLSDEELAKNRNISVSELTKKKEQWKSILREYRKSKPLPRLDYKIITSWNALMLKAYMDAYRVFKNPEYANTALRNASFLKEKMIQKNGCLARSMTNNVISGEGFLDDYAYTIQSFITLYESTFESEWLELSKKLLDFTIQHFLDPDTSMFHYSSKASQKLIHNPVEYRDNVLPSSNSVMAKCLFWHSKFWNEKKYYHLSQQMLANVMEEMEKYPEGFYNWMDLSISFSKPFYEIAIVGTKAIEKLHEVQNMYLPNAIVCGTKTPENQYPLFENRFLENETLLYLCQETSCTLPEKEVQKILNNFL